MNSLLAREVLLTQLSNASQKVSLNCKLAMHCLHLIHHYCDSSVLVQCTVPKEVLLKALHVMLHTEDINLLVFAVNDQLFAQNKQQYRYATIQL